MTKNPHNLDHGIPVHLDIARLIRHWPELAPVLLPYPTVVQSKSPPSGLLEDADNPLWDDVWTIRLDQGDNAA